MYNNGWGVLIKRIITNGKYIKRYAGLPLIIFVDLDYMSNTHVIIQKRVGYVVKHFVAFS